jgi:hypothetical protein
VPRAMGQSVDSQVKDFVHQAYIHGVPYEPASQLGKGAVPILLSMLADQNETASWANIATTLGMIGEPSAVEPLIAFIGKGHGTLSSDEYDAKTAAVMALGYLLSKEMNTKALGFLSQGADPGSWDICKLSWNSPFARNSKQRDVELARVSILGLGLSGRPEAEQVLSNLQSKGVKGLGTTEQLRLNEVLTQASRANRQIRQNRMAAYMNAIQ